MRDFKQETLVFISVFKRGAIRLLVTLPYIRFEYLKLSFTVWNKATRQDQDRRIC
jgi:hypothetical protein